MRTQVLLCLAFVPLWACNEAGLSDGALDTTGWTIVEIGGQVNYQPVMQPDTVPVYGVILHELATDMTRSYDFPALVGTRNADINGQGTLATLGNDGVVRLSQLGMATFFAQRELDATGLAWSVDGTRLAVVVRAAAAEQGCCVLKILDEGLNAVSEVPVGFSSAPLPSTFTVSWSPEDTRIAVSTNVAVELVRAETIIVDLQSNNTTGYSSYANVLFLNTSTLVGVEQRLFRYSHTPLGLQTAQEIGNVVLLELDAGTLRERMVVAGADHPVSSRPVYETFLTIERVPIGVFDLPTGYYRPPLRLHDSRGSFSRSYGSLVSRFVPLVLMRTPQ